ncbi:hypothetical protein [Roseivivax isoporae]|uniref:Cyanovirin-N domain-containing protein n=1 Tax=Roseivivax isoporae LMG 25204 TaxID=1449351 RepID=X7FD04_9RHOB|nr:hypothetical protein [Roseivivax isoporae]ETX30792.1 hypothetical protein RISW2_07205 [Roseivivax isoporae LMG 25204]
MRRFMTLAFLAAAPAPSLADGFGFRTPTGNIYCNGSMEGGALLDCVIVNHEGQTCPTGLELHVGMGERGPAHAQCVNGPKRLSTYTDVADYGVTGRFGAIACTSESTGFTCHNADGHGFFLSRRAQRIF